MTLLLIPAFTAVVFLIPVQYDSTARLLVRLGRGAVSIDSTANLSQTVSLLESRLGQVNSVKELLASRELVERVVKQIGPDRILEPHGLLETTIDSMLTEVLPNSPADPAGDYSSDEVEEQLKLEAACKAFEDNLSMSSQKDAYTINLDIRTGDPFLSRDLLRALIEEYQKFHVESHQSVGALDFFETQASQAHNRAMNAQAAIRDAKTSRGIVDLAAAKASLGTAISALKQNLLNTENDVAAATGELQNLESQINELPRQIESEVTRGIPKVAGSAMRQRLFDLEVAYQDAAAKLTPDHPKMANLREQLKTAAAIAETELGDQPQTRETINPVRQQLELAAKTTTAKLVGAQSKFRSLQEQLETLTTDLAKLNQHEVELNQLTWEATLAEGEYMKTSNARATARQIAELDKQHMSEISVVQPATLLLKKTSPKRMILLVLAGFMAISLGFGQAILRGMLVVSREVESVGTQSTLANVPASRRDHAWHVDDNDVEPASVGEREILIGVGQD